MCTEEREYVKGSMVCYRHKNGHGFFEGGPGGGHLAENLFQRQILTFCSFSCVFI